MKKNGKTSSPVNTGKTRDKKGRFIKGVSGNPAGKPRGRVSIIARVRQILRDDPKQLEEIARDLIKDKKLRLELIRQIDGMPRQQMELEGEVGVKPILGGLSGIHSHDSTKEDSETNQED